MQKSRTRSVGRHRLLWAAIASAFPAAASAATIHTWASSVNGNWSNATNWSPLGVPSGVGDVANIVATNGTGFTVTYDYTGTLSTINTLTIDLTGAGSASDALSMAANTLLAAQTLIGFSGRAAFFQSGGFANLGNLTLGSNTGATGTYSLSGTGSLASASEFIGNQGAGFFTQSSGTNQVNGSFLLIGDASGSTGSYVLTGTGTVAAASAEFVGYSGQGTFLQTGGFNTAGFISVSANGGGGAYTLAGGVVNSSGNIFVGDIGTGAFVQSNGNVNAKFITLGEDLNGSGTYNLTGPGTVSTFSDFVGDNTRGTFIQSDGLNQVTSSLFVGNSAGAVGSYFLSGTGTLSVPFAEDLGLSGQGSFSQSGGVNHYSTLDLGVNSGTGSYTLSATGLLSGSFQTIGDTGTGVFLQTGGLNSFVSNNGLLTLGSTSTGNGTYTLNAGTITGSNIEYIGYQGQGTFVQNGGLNSTNLIDMSSVGGASSYTLAGGVVNSYGSLIVGDVGFGTFLHTSGAANVRFLYLGESANSAGVYNLSGPGTIGVATFESIGDLGNGTFNQSDGLNVVFGNTLVIGNFAGAVGNYSLSGAGTVSDNGIEYVGYSGAATFTQSGGLNHAINLDIGANTGTGNYNLSGGTITTSSETLGDAGTGIFRQTGGMNSLLGSTANLSLGSQASGDGQYLISAGTISVPANEFIAVDGFAILTQSGGLNQVAGDIIISGDSIDTNHASGAFNLSGGTASAANVYVGYDPISQSAGVNAQLTVSGSGVLICPGTVSVVNLSGNSATQQIQLFGGRIEAGALSFGVGQFIYGMGTLELLNPVTFDSAQPFNTTSGVFGSGISLINGQTLQVDGDQTLGGIGNFSLAITTGATDTVSGNLIVTPNGTLGLNGGKINGNVLNQGVFTTTGGVINGRLTNQTTLGLPNGFSLTSTGGVENDYIMSVNTGQVLVIGSPGLDNLGEFNLEGGTISGAGSVLNDFTGFMNAHGSISQGFTNYGSFTIDGILTQTAPSFNYNYMAIEGGSLLRGGNGVALSNYGFVSLQGGAISSSMINEPGGVIEGHGAISNLQTNFGQILVDDRSTLNIFSAWNNPGAVYLGGPGATLGGIGTLTNSGTIQGAGQINAGVVNNGLIQTTAGQLIIAGSGSSNGTAGRIQLATGTTLFYVLGLNTNSGNISITNSFFNNNNVPFTNTPNGSIEGSGNISSGGLTNNGNFSFGGAGSAIEGNLTNNATATLTGGVGAFGLITNNAGANFNLTGNSLIRSSTPSSTTAPSPSPPAPAPISTAAPPEPAPSKITAPSSSAPLPPPATSAASAPSPSALSGLAPNSRS
jgi:hypothetical protein